MLLKFKYICKAFLKCATEDSSRPFSVLCENKCFCPFENVILRKSNETITYKWNTTIELIRVAI